MSTITIWAFNNSPISSPMATPPCLRAILREIDRQQPLPPGLLLVGSTPESIELTFDRLTETVTELVAELRT